jgi:hypothetical protein
MSVVHEVAKALLAELGTGEEPVTRDRLNQALIDVAREQPTYHVEGRGVWIVRWTGSEGAWVCYPPEDETRRPSQPEWVDRASIEVRR